MYKRQIQDPVSGDLTKAGGVLWPIFGATNQMLASLILMMLSIYFWRLNKPVLPLMIPFIFVTTTTLTSLAINARSFIGKNQLLLVIDGILITLILWMLYEGWMVFRAGKSK